MRHSFRDFVDRAISIADAAPTRALTVVSATLGSIGITMRVGNERFVVRGDGASITVEDDLGLQQAVRLDTSVNVLLQLVDGSVEIEDAIYDGALDVRGTLDDVLRVVDVMGSFVRVLVTSRQSAELLRDLREWNTETTLESYDERT